MAVVKVKVRGTKKIKQNLSASAKGAKAGSVAAARATTKAIFIESQVLVPVETGSLKATGRIIESLRGKTFSASIQYGGPSSPRNVDYAVYVHEDLTKKHKPPTSAKFIELPFLRYWTNGEAGALFKTYIGGHIAREVKS